MHHHRMLYDAVGTQIHEDRWSYQPEEQNNTVLNNWQKRVEKSTDDQKTPTMMKLLLGLRDEVIHTVTIILV